jgi:hypothetical protein
MWLDVIDVAGTILPTAMHIWHNGSSFNCNLARRRQYSVPCRRPIGFLLLRLCNTYRVSHPANSGATGRGRGGVNALNPPTPAPAVFRRPVRVGRRDFLMAIVAHPPLHGFPDNPDRARAREGG